MVLTCGHGFSMTGKYRIRFEGEETAYEILKTKRMRTGKCEEDAHRKRNRQRHLLDVIIL